MASLKFIMDVDDDQPSPPSARGDAQDPARTVAQPHRSDLGTPSQAYAGHASGLSEPTTQQTSSPSVAPVASSRHAAASGKSSSAPSASTSTSASRSSNRRRSTASNDSMDHASYGSAASSSSVGGGLNPSNSPMRPMASSTSLEVPVKYTPITGRVSRARKGVPVHICEICRPPKTFTRAEHLRRHQLSHQTPGYPCTYPGCDRAFHRPDLLARHQSRHNESEGDRASAVGGGGEDDGQSSLGGRPSHLDFANPTGSSSGMPGMPGAHPMPSNPAAPPSDTPSTPNLSTHAPNLQPASRTETGSNPPLSPGQMGGSGGYEYSSQGPHGPQTRYAASPSFPVMDPSSGMAHPSMPGASDANIVGSFQQPRPTASIFANQGLSLPSLSIPESNLPELYHPDASPWASSASDSTYSTPASDNARNPRFWLGRHRSPTSDWPSTHLLSPYPNPISRDASRASLDSTMPTAAPPSMFANPFQSSQFNTAPSNPNYLMLDVSMTGFGSTESGGQHMSSPSSEMALRPHHRHSISASSIRTTAAPQNSGPLITPMQAPPDRINALDAVSRQKEQLMDMTGSHTALAGGGVGFNALGEFGGGFRDESLGGSGSAGGLLAALDLPMTGCGMPGVVVASQQLPRQIHAAIPGYVEVYWQKFHQLYPIVHRPCFEAAGEDVLRWAMAAVATQYLDTKEDRLRGTQLHEHAWQELKRTLQWNLQVMQAILLCEIFSRFRGRKAVTRPSKMFESLYSRVLYHNPALFASALPHTDQALPLEDRYAMWIDAEARRRLLTACFITDVHTAAYQQQKRAHEWDSTAETMSPAVPLTARSAALWEASSAEQWASILASDPEAGIPSFAQSADSLTPEDLQTRPLFDRAAILALELVHLPALSPSTPSHVPSGGGSSTGRTHDDNRLDPLIRPKSTPGYSSTNATTATATTTSSPTPSAHPLQQQSGVFPPISPLSDLSRPLAPPTRPKTTPSRIAQLFPSCARASTYLALHHTPLHDLLAVSGDTWIFSHKVLPATSFLDHQRRLKRWAEASPCPPPATTTTTTTTTTTNPGNSHNSGNAPSSSSSSTEPAAPAPVQSAPQATAHAARAILAFLARDADGEAGHAAAADLSDYWALYVCALIVWAFGHRAGAGAGGRCRRRGSGGGGAREGEEGGRARGEGGGGQEEDETDAEPAAVAWLRVVAGAGVAAGEVGRVRARRETGAVVRLVRTRLERDCVGGRSRLFVDAVGVLRKLEEGANWKWF